MKRLMNIDELADYLRLRKQTIYNWLHQKKISGLKVGGVWRFDKREVDTWLKGKRLILPKKEGAIKGE
jgi:excisionase family DNA binding protein